MDILKEFEKKGTAYQGENPDCGVLILSCDKNVNVLHIFFDFFNLNWPDCKFPVYLGLEEQSIDFFECNILHSSQYTWGARLKEYLTSIDNEFVMIILDDFIIEQTVHENDIYSVLKIMENNPNIANMTLTNIPDSKNSQSEYDKFLLRDRYGPYLINMQIGIWRREVLLSLIKDKESPWQTELYGSIRARKLDKYKFYCLVDDSKMPVKYNHGWLIVRGSWNGNEILRLNLLQYNSLIFDGRNILYSEFAKFSFTYRLIRRCNIMLRQIFSWFKIYI